MTNMLVSSYVKTRYHYDYAKLVKCFNIEQIQHFLSDKKQVYTTLVFESYIENKLGNGQDVFDAIFSIDFFPPELCDIILEYLPKRMMYDVILTRRYITAFSKQKEVIQININIGLSTFPFNVYFALDWICSIIEHKKHTYIDSPRFHECFKAIFAETDFKDISVGDLQQFTNSFNGRNMFFDIASEIPYTNYHPLLKENINRYLMTKEYPFYVLNIQTFLHVMSATLIISDYIRTYVPTNKCLIM